MRETIFNEDFFKKLNKINMYINFKLSGGTQGGRKSKAKGQKKTKNNDIIEKISGRVVIQ